VRLGRGEHLTLYAVYDVAVSNRTQVLRPSVLSRLRGGLQANGQLVFSGSGRLPVRPGSILVAPPSGTVPYGLLRKVSAVTVAHGQTVVATTDAKLTEAIPRGRFQLTSGATPASVQRAHAADLSLSLPKTPLSCGGSGVWVSANAHLESPSWTFSTEWDGHSPTMIKMSASIDGTVSASLTATDVSCDLSREFPAGDGTDPGWVGPMGEFLVAGVPVWLTPEVVGIATVRGSVEGSFAASGTAQAGVSASVTYDRTGLHPTFTSSLTPVSGSYTPGNSGSIGVADGGKLYFDIDNQRLVACKFLRHCDKTLGLPYIDVTAEDKLAVNHDVQPWWRVDEEFDADVGLVSPVIGVDVSQKVTLGGSARVAPPGTPRNVTATPGNEAAGVGWEPPPKNPADPPVKDELPCACLPGASYTVYLDGNEAATTTGTSVTLEHLTNGTTYNVSVRADAASPIPEAHSLESKPVSVTPTGPSGPTVSGTIENVSHETRTQSAGGQTDSGSIDTNAITTISMAPVSKVPEGDGFRYTIHLPPGAVSTVYHFSRDEDVSGSEFSCHQHWEANGTTSSYKSNEGGTPIIVLVSIGTGFSLVAPGVEVEALSSGNCEPGGTVLETEPAAEVACSTPPRVVEKHFTGECTYAPSEGGGIESSNTAHWDLTFTEP
jgi:hypothetical protein